MNKYIALAVLYALSILTHAQVNPQQKELADPGEAALQAHITEIIQAANAKDFVKLEKLMRGTVPELDTVYSALNFHLLDKDVKNTLNYFTPMRKYTVDDYRKAFNVIPTNITVNVYKATTADFISYIKDSDAVTGFDEKLRPYFLDGSLRDNKIFYSVALVENNNPPATMFPIVFWDGATWKQLGPVWDSFPAEKSIYPPSAREPENVQKEYIANLNKRINDYEKLKKYHNEAIKAVTEAQPYTTHIAETHHSLQNIERHNRWRVHQCTQFINDLNERVKKHQNGDNLDAILLNLTKKIYPPEITKLETELKHLKTAKLAKEKIIAGLGQNESNEKAMLSLEMAKLILIIRKKEMAISKAKLDYDQSLKKAASEK